MDINTAYKTLGLENNASKEDILAAYRKLAKQWHPDVNKDPEAEETFKKISHAYELLTRPPLQQQHHQPTTQNRSPFFSSPFGDLDFEAFFATMNNASNNTTTKNSRTTITLELFEDISSPQMANKIVQILSDNGIKVRGYSSVTTTARQA